MKPNEIKISEVLHLAADHYLASNNKIGEWGPFQYSCTAINEALRESLGFKKGRYHTHNQAIEFRHHFLNIEKGLRNLGLEYPGEIFAFKELEDFYNPTEESQSARYIWLKWCALMAEEQGE